MRIENVNVLKGPNYWSIKWQHLIAMTLDLEDLEERPTNTIPGFHERIQALLPSMTTHRCSEGVEGGFFLRVQEGTWMGHVIEHIALEIQSLAGIDAGFGRTRGTGKHGQYHVVFAYGAPESGKYAGYAAVRIAEALIAGTPYNVQADVDHIRCLYEDEKLGPSTGAIVEEAVKRGIPFIRLNNDAYVQLGYGKKQQRIEATITCRTSSIAVEAAGCKLHTKRLLEDNYIPVPIGKIVKTEEGLKEAVEELGYPIVIKPSDANHGKGVTTNLYDYNSCVAAFLFARHYSNTVIVEQSIEGEDYRVLLINNKFVAAAKRSPAHITGDGVHTIEELITMENANGLRGDGHNNVLTKIPLDETTVSNVKEVGFDMHHVLAAGQVLRVRKTANLSTGGTAENVTDTVHPDNIKLFERTARVIGLDICGLDIIAKDLSAPLKSNRGVIIEVNAAPGFRMHLAPTIGEPVNVAKPVVDMLFPNGECSRIPIIAITGTNGKTTTTRLIANMVKSSRRVVGYTTTDGIYINDELVTAGDCSGPVSAQTVLKDSSVEVAVLETARGGILRSGLGFDRCDVAVITNIAEDHLGLGGIDTIEKLANVKSVVAEAVHERGWAVLNADDDLVYDMRNRVKCKVALFSLHGNSPRIEEHCRRGGTACFTDDQYVILRQGVHQYRRIQKINHIPITLEGRAVFNVYNVLAAVLAAHAVGCTTEQIKNSLFTFSNNAKDTPGRVNMFRINNSQILIDYAHNPHGLRAIGTLISSYKDQQKVGIITGVGDRRTEDIIAYGKIAGELFDVIIIRIDEDTRGRAGEEIAHLIKVGIQDSGHNPHILQIDDEVEALDYAINVYNDNSLIFLGVEDIKKVLAHMKQKQTDTEKGEVMQEQLQRV